MENHVQRDNQEATLRIAIDEAIASGDTANARALLTRLWQQHSSTAVAGFVTARFERLHASLASSRTRVALLRSYTLEPVIPLLRAAAYVNGLDLDVQLGDFNTYAQEILNPQSQLYRFAPEIVLLAVQTRDIAPELWHTFADLSSSNIADVVERVVENFRSWIQAFRFHSQAHLVIHALELPISLANGVFDTQQTLGQAAAIRDINLALVQTAREYTGVYILDYDALVARHGREAWYDERKWLTMRMPIRAEHLSTLANEWLRFIHPLSGRVCKALVVDLDNTLWGGVVGEDGINGIKIGADYSGAAYQSLQRTLLDLYHRGIILAVCSKNNAADALEALEQHPQMLIRPHHFAALRINWNDKAQNLREIAAELNIGLDSLAFLDDNHVERELIRSHLPEVNVIELPDDPTKYAQTLRNCPVFERLALSSEDRERSRYYAEQRQRSQLEQHASSLEDFLRSLQIVVQVALATPETIGRAAQLTQKTNQFNLTTRRYSEQQIAALSADPTWRIYTVRVLDRFGDNGLTGVVIIHLQNDVCEIDTLLLSCRVIGRTVETALLATIATHAGAAGARYLIGTFIATKKNAPAREFYPSHGFVCTQERENETVWEYDLTQGSITIPEWIDCRFI